MVDLEQRKKRLGNNKKIEYKDLMTELYQMQSSSTRCVKNISFHPEEKQIVDMDGRKSIKVFDSYIKNCDFMNISLNKSFDRDQKIMEGNIFENCSFVDCAGIVSLKDCVFLHCTFASSDFRSTEFIDCYFENVTATNCDFRKANFSLSNYKSIYITECTTEESLLFISESNAEKKPDSRFEKTALHLLKASLELMYDAINFCDDKGRLESMALELSEMIQDKENVIERESVRQMNAEEVYENITRHEQWSAQIKREGFMPDIDWRNGNYKGMDFSCRNLMNIDFSDSLLKGCDFSSCVLTGVNFTNCDLTGAVFNHSVFSGNCFDGAILKDISMDRKNMKLFQDSGIITMSDSGLFDVVKDRKIKI